jgi:hypothetical protein
MVPSAEELIEIIRHGLTTQVAPEVDDQMARSVLRSIDTLLVHLAARIGSEAALLAADNADLRQLLGHPPIDERGPTTEALGQANRALRAELDTELARVLADGDAAGLAAIDAYLGRHLEREAPLVFPAFAGRTY